jgi:hypothetical protein
MRAGDGAFLGQVIDTVFDDERVERRAHLLPIRNQRVQRGGIEHSPGEDVRPDLRTLLQQADGNLAPLRRGQLLQPDRRRKSRRPAAYDYDIVVDAFTRNTCQCSAPPGSLDYRGAGILQQRHTVPKGLRIGRMDTKSQCRQQ